MRRRRQRDRNPAEGMSSVLRRHPSTRLQKTCSLGVLLMALQEQVRPESRALCKNWFAGFSL